MYAERAIVALEACRLDETIRVALRRGSLVEMRASGSVRRAHHATRHCVPCWRHSACTRGDTWCEAFSRLSELP
jgi:hypothetical protein